MNFLKASPQYVAFAPIDLKNAEMYLRDGWGNQAGVASCTNTDLEPLGELTIALTSCNLVVPVGMTVHFANDATDSEYTVASVVGSGGSAAVYTLTINGDTGVFRLTFEGEETTDVAVAADPLDVQNALEALDAMPNGTVTVTGTAGVSYVITWNNNVEVPVTDFTLSTPPTGGAATFVQTAPGSSNTSTDSITLSVGLQAVVASGGAVNFTGNVLEVKIGEGALNYIVTKERTYVKDRGLIDTVRNGDETPVQLNFDFIWEYITGAPGSGVPTIEDALDQVGEASGWITTSADPCEPYCVDFEIRYDPNCGGANTEKILLQFFRHDTLDHSLVDASIACAGQCNITTPVATRGT